jgi:hypothetical protein
MDNENNNCVRIMPQDTSVLQGVSRPNAKDLQDKADSVEILTASDAIYASMFREAARAIADGGAA